MTGGQTSMAFAMEGDTAATGEATIQRIVRQASKLRVVFATDEELAAHEAVLIWWRRGRKLPLAGINTVKGAKNSGWAIFAANDSKREKTVDEG
ncbi:DNA polymerase III subunit epsilon [Escherichia coli]|nr:DNA polymerase III subunit epsilon [Escherichia coli]